MNRSRNATYWTIGTTKFRLL